MKRTFILSDFVRAADESHPLVIDRGDGRWREAGPVGICAVQELEATGSNFPDFAYVTTVHGEEVLSGFRASWFQVVFR